MLEIRRLKDYVMNNKYFFNFSIFLINLPIIGDLYDLIYFRVARKKIRDSDFELIIEPNNLCNLRCIMCPYSKMKRKKETMNMDLFKKIVDQASDLNCKLIQFQQYNEPLLDKFLFERINYIRKKDKKIKIQTYSNGTLLDKKTREKILDNPLDVVRFSVDGATKKTYESIRQGAVFEEVVENIQKLVKERNARKQKLPIIEVYFTILKENKEEINEFLKFWKGKCDYVSLYPADSRESEDFSLINYKNKKQSPCLKQYPCFNPKNLFILSSGKVTLCCVDYEGEVILGDLKKQKLKEIINSKKVKDIFESQMKRKCELPICKRCSKLYTDSAFQWWA